MIFLVVLQRFVTSSAKSVGQFETYIVLISTEIKSLSLLLVLDTSAS